MSIMQMMLGAGGASGLSVGEVFSTDLWVGNETARDITNGIDLDGEGGLVWVKAREATEHHGLFDTERGANEWLCSHRTEDESTVSGNVTAFNSDGYSIGTAARVNEDTLDNVGWTFRKAKKFFDIVSWTGNTDATREISHSLGCDPGMIIYKARDNNANWYVWHKGLSANQYLVLHTTAAPTTVTSSYDEAYAFGKDPVVPTSTEFTIGNWTGGGSSNYIGYVFAEDEDNIKCGTYDGDGNEPGPTITLGWEPQWLIIKRIDAVDSWPIYDTARGGTSNQKVLIASANNAESDNSNLQVNFTSTGFQPQTDDNGTNADGGTYAYMAIKKAD